jgi:hypothetical protein
MAATRRPAGQVGHGPGLYVANAVSILSGIAGRLRATDNDASLPRDRSDRFWAEAGARAQLA